MLFALLPIKLAKRSRIWVEGRHDAELVQHVWGEDYFGDDNTVNVHISNLRSKLGKASKQEYIKTVWGIGFKMSDL